MVSSKSVIFGPGFLHENVEIPTSYTRRISLTQIDYERLTKCLRGKLINPTHDPSLSLSNESLEYIAKLFVESTQTKWVLFSNGTVIPVPTDNSAHGSAHDSAHGSAHDFVYGTITSPYDFARAFVNGYPFRYIYNTAGGYCALAHSFLNIANIEKLPQVTPAIKNTVHKAMHIIASYGLVCHGDVTFGQILRPLNPEHQSIFALYIPFDANRIDQPRIQGPVNLMRKIAGESRPDTLDRGFMNILFDFMYPYPRAVIDGDKGITYLDVWER